VAIQTGSYVRGEVEKTLLTLQAIVSDEAIGIEVERIAGAWIDSLRSGGKILFAGNGGSAADAQHFAAELVNRLNYDRPALAGIALTVDTSALTSIGNDCGFEQVFARQVSGLGRAGDVFVGISTSGRSRNILAALEQARRGGLVTVGFTGQSGGEMPGLCDYCIRVPAAETTRIQEGHIVLGHILCGMVEMRLFPR
jgi:D-sedoheptulose 7-phosphate isomerase